MAKALYQYRDMAYQAAWTNLSQQAASQGQVLLAAPGSLMERNISGCTYLVHQFQGVDGKRRQVSVGAIDDPRTNAAQAVLYDQIEVAKKIISQIRTLAKLGYQVADPKTYSVAATLHNAGLFRHGLALVGSHAYGVLLNTLGVIAVPYMSNDVDVARGATRKLAAPTLSFTDLLAQTQLKFVSVPRVPPFNPSDPSTSFKELGKSGFRVDLLVPSRTQHIRIIPVPELNAHAIALPYLSYLLEGSFMSTLISRHGAVPVRVPDPARFALHKLLVAALRVNERDKIRKDIHQAAVLLLMLAEHQPGDIEDALAALPKSAHAYARKRLPDLQMELGMDTSVVWEALSPLLK